ncbi:MAG TPA: helix-turn-helix domain-containing protein, partial [Eudoraea sp.]|nr:helix-turn-helix domain-containing protein [Eudoraea sp.]
VNLASRVESLGVAGAVLISDKVREEISNQNIRTELMGTFHFKNDEYPRDIYAVRAPALKVPRPESLEGKTEKRASVTRKLEKEPAKEELLSMDDHFQRSIREIILNNLANPQFSVEVLSKEAGYSRPQLYRKVKALTNRSPTDLIREIRLEKAAQLLRNNTGNVSEIAYETGFNNLSYFSKAFQERFGSSPSVYARKRGGGAPAFLTQFIEREKEIAEILEILSECRLLTLTGTGGTGKTRLATLLHMAPFWQISLS